MTENPSVSYVNRPSFPNPPSTQRYDLRRKNWMVPFTVPNNHRLVVKINETETSDFHFYGQVVTLDKQPADGDYIFITTEELPDENNTTT